MEEFYHKCKIKGFCYFDISFQTQKYEISFTALNKYFKLILNSNLIFFFFKLELLFISLLNHLYMSNTFI